MTLIDRLLDWPPVYRTWQRPFQTRKFAPILAHNRLDRINRVLDVGCGPGTNAPFFSASDYLGLDVNEKYVESARRRYGRDFMVADVRTVEVDSEPFDFILANSLFHHLSDSDTDPILENLKTLLSDEGFIHILDLVLPERFSMALLLARWDRGEYPRPLSRWLELFEQHFETVVFEPYTLCLGPAVLWNMVYFKGRARRHGTF